MVWQHRPKKGIPHPHKGGYKSHRRLGLKHPHKGSHVARPGGHHPHTMVKHPAQSGARHHTATGKPHNKWGKNAHHGWPHHKGPISARAKLARLGKKHPHKGTHRPRPGGHHPHKLHRTTHPIHRHKGGHHHHTGSHKPQRHKGTLHRHAHIVNHKAHPHKGGNHHAHKNTAQSVIAMKRTSTSRVGKKHPHKGGHKGIINAVQRRRIQSHGRQPNLSITPNQAMRISRPHQHRGRHGRPTMSGKYTGVSTMITIPVHRLIIQGLRPPKPHKAVWVNHRSKHWNHKRGHRKRSW